LILEEAQSFVSVCHVYTFTGHLPSALRIFVVPDQDTLNNSGTEYVQIVPDPSVAQLSTKIGEILTTVQNHSLEFTGILLFKNAVLIIPLMNVYAGFKQTVVKQLAGIKEEIRSISSTVQPNEAPEERSQLIIDRPALPLMNNDQLNEFELWLTEEDKYKTVVSEVLEPLNFVKNFTKVRYFVSIF